VARSPILPLAAAVTAVALGASPAAAAPLSPGKRETANVVAFPLLAVKVQNSTGLGYHVSHSSHDSHVSGGGYHNSHYSHSSHDSHSSSVPAPVASGGLAPAAPGSGQPAPASSQNLGSAGVSSASPAAVVPSQSGLGGSPLISGSGSPAASGGGGGCAFVVIAPFSAAARGIKRLATWRRSR
jgi:hypothetical protein